MHTFDKDNLDTTRIVQGFFLSTLGLLSANQIWYLLQTRRDFDPNLITNFIPEAMSLLVGNSLVNRPDLDDDNLKTPWIDRGLTGTTLHLVTYYQRQIDITGAVIGLNNLYQYNRKYYQQFRLDAKKLARLQLSMMPESFTIFREWSENLQLSIERDQRHSQTRKRMKAIQESSIELQESLGYNTTDDNDPEVSKSEIASENSEDETASENSEDEFDARLDDNELNELLASKQEMFKDYQLNKNKKKPPKLKNKNEKTKSKVKTRQKTLESNSLAARVRTKQVGESFQVLVNGVWKTFKYDTTGMSKRQKMWAALAKRQERELLLGGSPLKLENDIPYHISLDRVTGKLVYVDKDNMGKKIESAGKPITNGLRQLFGNFDHLPLPENTNNQSNPKTNSRVKK